MNENVYIFSIDRYLRVSIINYSFILNWKTILTFNQVIIPFLNGLNYSLYNYNNKKRTFGNRRAWLAGNKTGRSSLIFYWGVAQVMTTHPIAIQIWITFCLLIILKQKIKNSLKSEKIFYKGIFSCLTMTKCPRDQFNRMTYHLLCVFTLLKLFINSILH